MIKTARELRAKLMRASEFSAWEYRDWIIEKSNSWLCDCGNWITDGFHCTLCGNEPPWGCDCSQCDGEREDQISDEELWEQIQKI